AWLAVRKWLVIGVIGVSAGEISLPNLWAHAQTLGTQLAQTPWPVQGFAPMSLHAIPATLIANTLLAAAIWFAVRGLQLWARATVKHHEEEFAALIERDERQRGI
ncbi:MAG TPA: hypothetical protein VFM56_15735, partial [Solimonas sp.]|nr:hypothetical protein [Solimonas sp.]